MRGDMMAGYIKLLVVAAINRAGLDAARRIARNRGLVVFGTMDGGVLEKLVYEGGGVAVPVYFYEPG